MTAYSHLGRTCEHCGRVFYGWQATGRPKKYCSNACKQRAYRRARDDKRGRRITEAARAMLDKQEQFRNVAGGPGGDRRFDVTKDGVTP